MPEDAAEQVQAARDDLETGRLSAKEWVDHHAQNLLYIAGILTESQAAPTNQASS